MAIKTVIDAIRLAEDIPCDLEKAMALLRAVAEATDEETKVCIYGVLQIIRGAHKNAEKLEGGLWSMERAARSEQGQAVAA